MDKMWKRHIIYRIACFKAAGSFALMITVFRETRSTVLFIVLFLICFTAISVGFMVRKTRCAACGCCHYLMGQTFEYCPHCANALGDAVFIKKDRQGKVTAKGKSLFKNTGKRASPILHGHDTDVEFFVNRKRENTHLAAAEKLFLKKFNFVSDFIFPDRSISKSGLQVVCSDD